MESTTTQSLLVRLEQVLGEDPGETIRLDVARDKLMHLVMVLREQAAKDQLKASVHAAVEHLKASQRTKSLTTQEVIMSALEQQKNQTSSGD
jgi:hypothetical protein